MDAAPLARDGYFRAQAQRILAELVAAGDALGWVDPPTRQDIDILLDEIAAGTASGETAIVAAVEGTRLHGFGYWRRYARATHRPHADLERMAVTPRSQGHGIGRALLAALIAAAKEHRIEVLTLDARGDNDRALRLYRSEGFVEYGRLRDFVAVGERRYDKVFCALDLREGR